MFSVVSLYLPTWPTDRLRRTMGAAAPDAALPLVLVGQTGRRLTAANAAAVQTGLRIGMPASELLLDGIEQRATLREAWSLDVGTKIV